jgi:hypothetical protein
MPPALWSAPADCVPPAPRPSRDPPPLLQSDQARLGRLKKTLKYLFSGQPELRAACGPLLRAQLADTGPDALLASALGLVRRHWRQGGPEDPVLVNHMAMKGAAAAAAAAAPYGERQWQAAPRAACAGAAAAGGAEAELARAAV